MYHAEQRTALCIINVCNRSRVVLQVSAFPDAYAKWEGLAREAVANFAS